MRRTKKYGRGELAVRWQVLTLSWTFLHNLTVSFGGCLLWSYYYDELNDQQSFSLPLPDLWPAGGSMVGLLLAIISLTHFETRSAVCLIRCFQISIAVNVYICYKIQNTKWAQPYFMYGVYFIFALQEVVDSMSQVVTMIYILETGSDRGTNSIPEIGFDRGTNSNVVRPLLVSCQLPHFLSKLIHQLISRHKLFITLGVGIYSGLFFIVLLLFIFLPKSSENGEITENSDSIDYWHLQFKSGSGWVRPLASSLALTLLCELCGQDAFHFYADWSFRLASLPIDPPLFTSILSTVVALCSLSLCTKDRLSPVLLLSTASISLSCFLNGIVLHGLASLSVTSFLPFVLFVSFTIGHTAGLGLLTPLIPAVLVPRDYRPFVFSINLGISQLSRWATIQTTPLLLSYLRPYGVFWLDASIAAIGCVYEAASISGQVEYRRRTGPPSRRTLQQFVTQV